MGCSDSKAKPKAPVKGKPKTRPKRSSSESSQDSLDRARSKQNGTGDDSELTEEEIEALEKEQREQIWEEKATLRDRIRTENMMDGECFQHSSAEKSVSDLLKQEQEMISMNNDAIRLQKQTRRRLLKRRAEKEQKWMVFSNLDCFDEADLNVLTDFLTKVMNFVPKLHSHQHDENDNGSNAADGSCGNAIADYLTLKGDKSVHFDQIKIDMGSARSSENRIVGKYCIARTELMYTALCVRCLLCFVL
jgi:hypothetical protein